MGKIEILVVLRVASTAPTPGTTLRIFVLFAVWATSLW
jgi:hypothetical protein